MVIIPTWQAATAGFAGNAGHVNQLLSTHSATFVYGGTVRSSQATGTGVFSDTQTQWLSQLITVANTQTSIIEVNVQVSTIGGSPITPLINPLSVSIYADSGGFPTGSALVSGLVTSPTVYSAPFWVTVVLPLNNLVGGTNLHIVVQQVGTSGHYYVWQRSNQPGGAHTSTNGTSWTALNYGLMYQVLEPAMTGGSQVLAIYEDGGARFTSFTYNTNGTIKTITESTVAQGVGNVLMQTRTLNYANGLMTGVS